MLNITQHEEHCIMCKRQLDVAGDPLSMNCGGDCWGCIGRFEAEMGCEESVKKVQDEIAQGLRDLNGYAK